MEYQPLSIVIDLIPIVIVTLTIALQLRQTGSYFRSVKVSLTIAYGLFLVPLVLEVLRDIVQSVEIGFWYTTLGASALLLAALALAITSVTISNSPSLLLNYIGLPTKKELNLPFLLYLSYTMFLIVALWVVSPFTVEFIPQFYDGAVVAPRFEPWYIIGLSILIVGFFAYPSRLMILYGRKVSTPVASGALKFLPMLWTGSVIAIGVFNVYLRSLGIDTGDIGHILAGSLLGITAYYFRKATLLEIFFESLLITDIQQIPSNHPADFSRRLGIMHTGILGKKILFEFDPSAGYESIVKDFVHEGLSRSELVLIISRKGSPVYQAVGIQLQVKFLCLTSAVSRPEQGSSSNEILVPIDDAPVTLDALNRVVKSSPEAGLALVFDSISEILYSMGTEKSYRFLKHSLELISDNNITALYLLNSSSHDPKIVSSIRALFGLQIVLNAGQLETIKDS